jgi:hypothetical protein
MKNYKDKCNEYLMICCNYGDANSGLELFCDRLKGHKGKHRALATKETGTSDTPIHEDIVVYWKQRR